MGWGGLSIERQVQRDSVAAIREAGGKALYDRHVKNGSLAGNPKPAAPSWLEKRIGVDYFQNVTYVFLPNSGSVRELVAIGHLDRLEMLILGGSGVSDDGLSHLKGLTNLQVLDLSGTDVTGDGTEAPEGPEQTQVVESRSNACH